MWGVGLAHDKKKSGGKRCLSSLKTVIVETFDLILKLSREFENTPGTETPLAAIFQPKLTIPL